MLQFNENLKTFADPDIMSFESCEDENYKTVREEIERGRQLNEERCYWKKEKRAQIEPLFEKQLEEQQNARPVMYRYIIESENPPKSDFTCRHFGNFTLNRSFLTRYEHINFLSQAKNQKHSKQKGKIRAYYKKIFVPNLTARVDLLAMPGLRHMQNTMKNYSRYLKLRQLESLSSYLSGRNEEKIMSIDKAIQLMREEKMRKEFLRRKAKKEANLLLKQIECKRYKQVVQVIWSLFEVMKDFLMAEHCTSLKSQMRLLSNLIVYNVAEFAGFQVPSPKSQEFIDKFIIDLCDNLAVWINKFTTNFGFFPFLIETSETYTQKQKLSNDLPTTNQTGANPDLNNIDNEENQTQEKTIEHFKHGKGHFYLPLDDYIPLSDSSLSDLDGISYHPVCEETIQDSANEDYLCEECCTEENA